MCADIVNQLVNELKKERISASMKVVGSMKRNMVTQNGNRPIDFDFNLLIEGTNRMDASSLKETVRRSFNVVLRKNGWDDCKDSTSVLTTEQMALNGGNRTLFSIDVCIVSFNQYGQLQRLIHDKTGIIQYDQWYWNTVPKYEGLKEKEGSLKPTHWNEVREKYIEKKNMYLRRNDNDHPSFICYIEAVNEVYFKTHHELPSYNMFFHSLYQ